MKVVQINTFSNKSTGNIMMNIHKKLLELGHESYVVWGRGRNSDNEYEIFMNDKVGVYYHGIYTRLTDKTGFASKRATKKLIEQLESIKPDIIHLHNIHGYYINIELLFNYIKKNRIKVIWTLHDCWAFTGHCAYFDKVNCEKWRTGCYKCDLKNDYPKSLFDNSNWNYQIKKELFTGLDMKIITPSKWLANLVKKSFLNEYEVEVINNGINTDIFKPRKSNFRENYKIEDKKIILGVASEWTERKGLNDFMTLASVLKEDTKIILIGLSKKQICKLPKNILGIERTENAIQLAEIYSSADLFFNPTYADNYPTTNLEALACGTPVITYNTGGSPECLNGENGIVTSLGDFCDNYEKYLNKKYKIKNSKAYSNITMVKKYLALYKI